MKMTMRTGTGLLLMMTLLSFDSIAQVSTTFLRQNDLNISANFASAVVADSSDNSYVIDLAGSAVNPDFECLGLVKLDAHGDILWEKCFEWRDDRSYRGGGNGCIDLTTDEIVIVGDEDWQPIEELDRFFIAFFDTSGQMLDTFFFEFPEAEYQQFVRGVLVFDDETFYAFGAHEVPSGTFSPLFVSKITRDGREVWRKFYFDRVGIGANPEALALMDDSTLLLTGTHFGSAYAPLVAAIDTSGEVRWEYEFTDSTKIGGTGFAQAEPDGVGGSFLKFNYDSLLGFWRTPYIQRLDPNGDIMWEYRFDNSRDNSIGRIKTMRNGDLVGSGYYNLTAARRYIFRLSPHGELRWLYEMPANLRPDLRSGTPLEQIELSSGDIFFVGTMRDTFLEPGGQDALYLRITADGECFDPSCPEMELIYSSTTLWPPRSEPIPTLILYPNPVRDQLTIKQLPSDARLVTAYDMRGSIKRSWLVDQASDDYTLRVSGMPTGVYHVVVRDEGGQPVGEGRFLVNY